MGDAMKPIRLSEIDTLVNEMDYQDRCRVLANALVDLFRVNLDDGTTVIRPDVSPTPHNLVACVEALRREFWPEHFPAKDAAP